ncbi:nectin-3-like protein isoform X1 [Melanotaenia boesemani]|uniref:nectin-3-like protein isoform X1 n=1 Tax=Melanotaenia boesemani TaxID=1250792 RepID=UPI001C0421B2|nr:nectin-3-like protein isoform X1 [Melanotaenia boesemani]
MLHILLLLRLLLSCRQIQAQDGSSAKHLGDTATLPCKQPDTSDALTQISWQRITRGKPNGDNFYTIDAKGPNFINGDDNRFTFVGDFRGKDGTLQLSSVTLMDEGTYTCIITLFPSGNQRQVVPLRLLVPPSTSLENNPVILGDEEVLIANCTAAGSKPPADVKWKTNTLGQKLRVTNSSTQHENGTTTTVSSLFGKPTREINGGLVQCVVTAEALREERTLPLKIQVHFSPTEVIISETGKDSFECKSEANPNATITWSRTGQSRPPSARVDGAVLQFTSMTSDLTGLYQCEASNPYGRKEGFLYIHVSSGGSNAGWVLFALLLAVLLIGAGVWKLWQSEKWRSCRPGREEPHGDPNPSSPEQPGPHEDDPLNEERSL